MLRILPFFIFICSWLVSSSQTIETIEKDIYYHKYTSAIAGAQAIVRSENSNPMGWYQLTKAYLTSDKNQIIIDSINFAPEAVKSDPYFQIAYGQILLNQKKNDSAKIYFDNALSQAKKKEGHIHAAIARAHIEEEAGNVDYAIGLLQTAIKKDKKNAEYQVLLGDAYRRKGAGSEAYKAYEEALQYDKAYAVAMYKIGKIFLSQKNPEIYLNYFNKAVNTDPDYAPALYELYYHYYFKDAAKAMEYLQKYIAASEPSIQNDYLVTDLLYTSRKYEAAIDNARRLLAADSKAEPRLYKLIAYSFKETNRIEDAYQFMTEYFSKTPDSVFVLKDFEAMADIYTSMNKTDSATFFLAKAASLEMDTAKKVSYYQRLADIAKKAKNYEQETKWLSEYYKLDSNASNLVLFNWGVAHYMAKQYLSADSVFTIYTQKYPDQHFGFYWRAKTNAAIDTAMEQGLAIPHYLKVIEMVEKDTTNEVNKKRLIEGYGYLATYKANTEKDFASSIEYFEKLLSVQPDNADAKKYIEILKKSEKKKEGDISAN